MRKTTVYLGLVWLLHLNVYGGEINLLQESRICGGHYDIASGTVVAKMVYFSVDLPDSIERADLDITIAGQGEVSVLNRTLVTRMPMFRLVGQFESETPVEKEINLHSTLTATVEDQAESGDLSLQTAENKLLIRVMSSNDREVTIHRLSVHFEPGKTAVLPNVEKKILCEYTSKDSEWCAVLPSVSKGRAIPVDDNKGWLLNRTLSLNSLPTGMKRYDGAWFDTGEETTGIFIEGTNDHSVSFSAPDAWCHSVHFLLSGAKLKGGVDKWIRLSFTDGTEEIHAITYQWNLGNWYRDGFPNSSFMGNKDLPKSWQVKVPSVENDSVFSWSSLYHLKIEAPSGKFIQRVSLYNESESETVFLRALSFSSGNNELLSIIPEDYTPKANDVLDFNVVSDRPLSPRKPVPGSLFIQGNGAEKKIGTIDFTGNSEGMFAQQIRVDLSKLNVEPGLYRGSVLINSNAYEGVRFGIEHVPFSEKDEVLFLAHVSAKDEIVGYPAPHMDLIQRSGYDGVRLQIFWNQFESDEGVFDFSDSDRILDSCAANELKVEYVPALYATKRSGQEHYGVPDKYVTSLTLSNLGLPGRLMAPSLWDESFLQAKCRMYATLGEHYMFHPAFHSVYLCGIGHMNGAVSEQFVRVRDLNKETIEVNGQKMDAEEVAALKEKQFFGFEEEAQQAFRKYLLREYGSLDAVCRELAVSTKKLNDLSIPGSAEPFGEKYWKAYLKFRVQSSDAFLNSQTEAFVSTGNPAPVVSDIGNISRFNELYLGTVMSDITSRCLKYGGEFSEDGSTYLSDAFFSIRYAQKHGVEKTGFESAIGASHEEFMRTVWNAILLQVPDSVFVSYNRGGLFNPNSSIYKPYVELACSADKIEDDFSVYVYEKACSEMGIVTREKAKGWWFNYRNTIDNLAHIGYSFDLCNETLKDAFSSKAVVDGVNPAVSEEALRRIVSYIETGGTYIADISFLRYKKGIWLEKIFGIKTVPYRGENSILFDGQKIPLSQDNNLAVWGAGSVAISKFGNEKNNAIIECPYGRGRLILLACNLNFSKEAEREVYEAVLRRFGVEKNIAGLPYGVQNGLFEKEGVYYLFLMNLTVQDKTVRPVVRYGPAVKSIQKGFNMNSGLDIPVVSEKEQLSLGEIQLMPYEIVCLKLFR